MDEPVLCLRITETLTTLEYIKYSITSDIVRCYT